MYGYIGPPRANSKDKLRVSVPGAWAEIQSRERHPDVEKYKAALANVERGIHDFTVRFQHQR